MYTKCYFKTCKWEQSIDCYACYENHVLMHDDNNEIPYPHDTDFGKKSHLNECENNVPIVCEICKWKQQNDLQCSKCYFEHINNSIYECKNNETKLELKHSFLCNINSKIGSAY